MTTNEKPATPSEKESNGKRRVLLLGLTACFIVIALIYSLYWLAVGRFYEETDDAYVNGNIIPITAQVGGTVVAVKADNTQFVKTNQLLVQLDPIDSLVAFEQARANLGETIRNTQQLFLNNTGLQAGIRNREVSRQQALKDLSRRNQAVGVGAVSREELTHAQDSLQSADASLIQAQAALLSNRALTENTDLQQHPSVLAAAARLRQAYIDYKRSEIRAPAAGEIAKRAAQVGERIAAGTQLMALVPLDQVWVDANFKESQLRDMRIGQAVKLTADIYGSSVEYKGRIVGFSAGTGSAFALLPAQNATGNWIKVVQRLPVRIALEPKELKEHPLRIGLSMEATVDLHDTSGKLISETTLVPSYETLIYDKLGKEANAEVNKVISENVSKTAKLNTDAIRDLNKNAAQGTR